MSEPNPDLERFAALVRSTEERERDLIELRKSLVRNNLCGHGWTSFLDLNAMARMILAAREEFEAGVAAVAAKHGVKPRPSPPLIPGAGIAGLLAMIVKHLEPPIDPIPE